MTPSQKRRISTAEDQVSAAASVMIERPLDLIKAILYKHEHAVIEVMAEQQEELQRLRQICRNVYEVWAGSEGIPEPETAPEAYLLQLLMQMRDEVKKGI